MDDIFVLLGAALGVSYVPSEGFEERIDELDANLLFLVLGALVRVEVAVKVVYQ